MRISTKAAVGLLGTAAALAGAGIAIGAAGDDEHSAALAGKIDSSQPEERHPPRRRRHGRLRGDARPLLRQGRRRTAEHGPAGVPRQLDPLRAAAGPWPELRAQLRRATRLRRRRRGRPASARRTAGSRRARPPRTTCPAPTRATGRTWRSPGAARRRATSRPPRSPTPRRPAPSSHISQRACQGPADARTTCPTEAKTAATPGLGSIAEQQVDQGFDLYLGGGRGRYQQTLTAGRHRRPSIDYAAEQGLHVRLHQAASSAAIDDLAASGTTKVLGLFNALEHDHGVRAAVRPQQGVTTTRTRIATRRSRAAAPTTRCASRRPAGRAVAAGDDAKAIELLERGRGRLHAAGRGRLDRQARPRRGLCGQIGETLAFDDAIGVALDYQPITPTRW